MENEIDGSVARTGGMKNTYTVKVKGKVFPLQARCDPEGD